MRQNYATHLTRDYLEYLGITAVSEDGTKIMKDDKELTQHFTGQYNLITLYDPAIRQACPKELRTNTTGQLHFGVHRIVYCWYNRIIPNGLVVDHINNNKLDNRLANLQLLTPKANVTKEKIESTREIPCKLDRPRSYHEDKLAEYEILYEEAKVNKDADKAHKLRSAIAQTKARLRYYDSHIQEVSQLTEFQKDKTELAYWKKCFKNEGNKSMWHEVCKVERVAKASSIEDAQRIIKHALEVIHEHFKRG